MIAIVLAVFAVQDVLDFETDSGWEAALTGEGKPAQWKRVEDASAPSGKYVLVQENPDSTDYRFVMAVSSKAKIKSGVVWVRFKPMGGSADRAGGLVWRYQDARNYYVARANAMEGNLRLYKVVDGKRIQLANKKVDVSEKAWHTLVARFEGTKHAVAFDGMAEIETEDDQFQDAGSAGLWTKSDSLTYFDDLTILPEAPSPLDSKLWQALLSLGEPRLGFHTCRKLMAEGRSEQDAEAARLLTWYSQPEKIGEALKDAADWKNLLVRGSIEFRTHHAEPAVKTFSSVLEQRPGCLEALLARARARVGQPKAWRDAELAAALFPRSTRALTLLAQMYVADNKAPQALAILDRALEIDPHCVPAILVKGSAFLATGDSKKAILEYDRAIRIDPEEPRGYYDRSLAWEKEGNHDRSMKNAQKAAELAPEIPDPRHQMGRLFTLQPDYDAAVREFKKAVEIDPFYAKSIIGLGWVEAHRDKFEDAIKYYDEALGKDPSIAEGWALRGNAKWKLRRVDDSIVDYSKAIEISPSLAIAWANRGLAYTYQKKYAPAIRDFERAFELDSALRNLVGGDYERAKKELGKQEY